MPAKRLSMRKIKDVLRLCWGQGLSKRKAAVENPYWRVPRTSAGTLMELC